MTLPLLQPDERGLYCAAGDFHIDPWAPVPHAVITHAHGDHFARGCGAYLVAHEARHLFHVRLGADAPITTLPYGQSQSINSVSVSFHPAGHILGAAQIRVEHRGEVWVASGDYKRQPDPTSAPFEVVRCHTFITEATFALPIYRWNVPQTTFDALNAWWRANAAQGMATLVYCYALGKAQRVLAHLDTSIGKIFTHGSVMPLNAAYRASGAMISPVLYSAFVPVLA
jgi:putative mRNA 3-end processing factor